MFFNVVILISWILLMMVAKNPIVAKNPMGFFAIKKIVAKNPWGFLQLGFFATEIDEWGFLQRFSARRPTEQMATVHTKWRQSSKNGQNGYPWWFIKWLNLR